ncbi:peptidylprolyl isomerase [Fertoebacter nigrum]|uniref:Parvulin-like PPIase n=1 Tax=Fertoeibacter niger TaxID=2656921 RepID=A0A8X8GW11_9RHOB|nr:peptidylprolyl isomerase [Fertoeibacter niger]NUB45414.1 peptidylprolyl isomerase [Fertoeibacter niger]
MAIFARLMQGVALGAVCALGLAAPLAAQDATADTVVASVNGTDITLGHMIVLRASLPEQYQQLPDDALFNGILEQLIQQTALEQSVADAITKRDTLALENDRRGYLSGVALQDVVSAAITDEALQAAYDARFKDAAPQTEYNASHILVAEEARAIELKAEIDGGADFAELAIANSTDGAAAGGGSLGWFGLGMMVKPFEDAVVAMQPGEVVGPLQTQFGWHLVKLNETRIAEAPPLDALREELAAEIEQATVEAHVKGLTDAATITRPGIGIDPALLRDQTLLDK